MQSVPICNILPLWHQALPLLCTQPYQLYHSSTVGTRSGLILRSSSLLGELQHALFTIYFIYVQFKQTNIINTEIINTNTKLIQIQNLKLELLQSVYNCTWIWSKV